jgi:hypothetical protein
MYSCTFSFTSALEGVGGQRHSQFHGRSGRMQKILPPPGFDPRTVQPVASRYTDYAILAPYTHTHTHTHTHKTHTYIYILYFLFHRLPAVFVKLFV